MENVTSADLIGWVGAVLLLTAYALVSFKKLASDAVLYQMMNIIAGVFLAISSFSRSAYPLTFVNSVWSIIGLVAIGATIRNGKSRN